jgi:glycosyltransferase involved in cell wall biosynthesis
MADAHIKPVHGNSEDRKHVFALDSWPQIDVDTNRKNPTATNLEISNRSVIVVVPAYNEERFIGSVVLLTLRFVDTVIVVDDGSIDATAEVAAAAGAKVLRHPDNRGKAQALNTAFQMARDYAPDVVVTLDADGQHLPQELIKVAGPVLRGEADLVIGSRYLKRPYHVPRHRYIGHCFLNWLTGTASGVQASDSQSGFRAFSPRALSCSEFLSQGFSVEAEMQFIAGQQGLRIVEVPITVRYMDKPKRPVIQQGFHVLKGVLKLTGQYRSLFFFGLPGLMLFLFSLGYGAVVLDFFVQTHQLAIGSTFVCVLLFVAGLILISTAITLHSVRGLLIDLVKPQRSL